MSWEFSSSEMYKYTMYMSVESNKAVFFWFLALNPYRCYLAVHKSAPFFPSLTHSPAVQQMVIFCLRLHQVWLSSGVCLLPTSNELECRSAGS